MTWLLGFLHLVRREAIDTLGQGVVASTWLEDCWIQISRRFPNRKVVRAVSFAIARAARNTSNRHRVVTLRKGVKIVVDMSDMLGSLYFRNEEFESETVSLLHRLVREGDIVADVGAHSGYFTLLLADAVGPTGRVHAFEPNPELVELLEQSLRLNHFIGRVTVNRKAVANFSASDVRFYVSRLPHNSGVSSLVAHQWGLEHGFFSTSDFVFVETMALDEYFATRASDRLALIKIDVESAEAEVIAGMTRLLANSPPNYFICETAVPGDFDRIVREAGYTGYEIYDGGIRPLREGVNVWGNLLYVSPHVDCPLV